MNKKEALDFLNKTDAKLITLSNIVAALNWDFETSMSPKGGEARGDQLAWLSGLEHKEITNPKLGEVFDILKNTDLTTEEDAKVRILDKAYTQLTAVPQSLAEELVKKTNYCQGIWQQAREEGNFSLVAPALKEVVKLTKENASFRKNENQSIYDLLLDDYDTGYSKEEIDRLFKQMKEGISDVVRMSSNKEIDDSFLYDSYSKDKKKEICIKILNLMGFDFDRGVFGEAEHPFTNQIGADDIRITNRYNDKNLLSPIFSTLHEGGHALYEMGASSGKIKGTCLATGASMGFHESQSRLWENIIGHSTEFWKFYYPEFQKHFEGLRSVSFDKFIQAVNKVQMSDIRVDADEVTYGLHIILRFNLEKELFDGTLTVEDLPEAWNEESLKLFGHKPQNIKNGVLQDVHWYAGLFGYFPSYALGNLYNSQIWATLSKELEVNTLMEKGELFPIHNWLNNKVYSNGCIIPADQLIKQITNEELSASYFVNYLKEKYRRLYEYSK